jgi:hypothetical protein
MRTSDAMQRHDFDPVAFIFGVLFTGSGLLFLIGRFDLFNHTRWLWPGLLVLLGIAVLVGARGSSRARDRAVGGSAASAGPVADVPDLDDIEPPVGPDAFRLPGWPAKGADTPKPTASTATSKPTAGNDTDVLEPAEQETEEIAEVDSEAETRPLREQRPPEEPPASR